MQKIIVNLDIYPYQIDFLGHVSNTVYIQWMEIGRCQLLKAIGMPTHLVSKQGFVPILVHTSIDYKLPLYLGEQVKLEVWISKLAKASAILQFCFYNSEFKLAATGFQKGLFVEHKTNRPRKMLPDERALFMPYLE